MQGTILEESTCGIRHSPYTTWKRTLTKKEIVSAGHSLDCDSFYFGGYEKCQGFNFEENIDFIGLLESKAKEFLPEGTRYEIHASFPSDFGLPTSIYWFVNPQFAYESFWERNSKFSADITSGHFIATRIA